MVFWLDLYFHMYITRWKLLEDRKIFQLFEYSQEPMIVPRAYIIGTFTWNVVIPHFKQYLFHWKTFALQQYQEALCGCLIKLHGGVRASLHFLNKIYHAGQSVSFSFSASIINSDHSQTWKGQKRTTGSFIFMVYSIICKTLDSLLCHVKILQKQCQVIDSFKSSYFWSHNL